MNYSFFTCSDFVESVVFEQKVLESALSVTVDKVGDQIKIKYVKESRKRFFSFFLASLRDISA